MFISGIAYILLCCILYVVGFFFYYRARKQNGADQVFTRTERIVVAAVAVAGLVGLVLYAMGLA